MHGGKELIFEGGNAVDKDRVKGAINEVAGRAKRQVGEWTGDTSDQIEGLTQELKGKAQKTWGNVKDAARAAQGEARKENGQSEKDHAESGHPQHENVNR